MSSLFDHIATTALLCAVTVQLGCSAPSPPRPDQVTKIVISVGCVAPCVPHQITLLASGRFTYTDYSPPEESGTIDWSTIAKYLTQTTFFTGQTPYVSTTDDERLTDIYVDYDSTSRAVQFETAAHDQPQLRRFVDFVEHEVALPVYLSRRRQIARLADYTAVKSIRLEVGGCLGRCRQYDVIFNDDSIAHIRYALDGESPDLHTGIATVAFPHVLRILRETRYTSLRPQYPFHWWDTETVRLTVRYKSFTYVVDAPDETTRPTALTEILGRFDQLVEDLRWQPPLPKAE